MRESGVKTEKTLDQAWVWWLQVSSAVRGRAAGVTTHYTPVSLLARAAAGLHRRSSQGQLLQYLRDTMRQRQYIVRTQPSNPVYVAFAMLNSWTHWLTDIESQNSLCFNLFFTFVSILQTASWWRSVRVSAALPGYLTSLSVVGLDSGTAGLPCTTPHSSTVPQSVSILSSISCLCFRSVGARFLWVSSYSASTSPSQDCSKSGGLNVSLLKASSFLLMTIFVNLCYPLPS